MCFFFNDTATTEIYTLSLHDALPICESLEADVQDLTPALDDAVGHEAQRLARRQLQRARRARPVDHHAERQDRKSTRLNSSHANISYAVFCLKKKNTPMKMLLHA